ncbi:MAG: GNAT family N-acetyltransferase [Erysipelotrichaceae bacterium]|nr:GNAT family N-acetyltransferase [Erysipelotrichaceae bacterium]
MNAYIDISDVILKTPRLTLRPWRQSDLEDLYQYASVDGVGQMAGWPPHQNREESQLILNSFINKKKVFAIEYQGKAVGTVGIELYDEEEYPQLADKRCRKLGFVLARECWGKGLMPEAVREVIRYLFEDVGLDAILCGHFAWNKQSQRVQEKCGFRHYCLGTYETMYGTVEPEVMNLLVREDWLLTGKGAPERNISIIGKNYFSYWSRIRFASRGLIVQNDRILLSYETNKQQWSLPGGGLEKGETLADCGRREVEEETGMLVNDLQPLFTICEYYEDELYITQYFECAVKDGGHQHLTQQERLTGLQPQWLPLSQALEIFSHHEDYAASDEMRRGLYLREYTALSEYVKMKQLKEDRT